MLLPANKSDRMCYTPNPDPPRLAIWVVALPKSPIWVICYPDRQPGWISTQIANLGGMAHTDLLPFRQKHVTLMHMLDLGA